MVKKKVTKTIARKAVRAIQIQKLRDKGLSYREIAEKLGCSKSTVGRHLRERRIAKPADDKTILSGEGSVEEKEPLFDVSFWVMVVIATLLTILSGYFIISGV